MPANATQRPPSRLGDLPDPTDRSFVTAQKRSIRRFKRPLTTHRNGLSWPNAHRTSQSAEAYFRALPVPAANNTMQTLSASMNLPDERLQQFVTESPWEHDAVSAQLNEDFPPAVQSPDAILQVDGTPILKNDKQSVGVGRQWAGNVGKITNSQHAVDLMLTVPGEEINANQVTWPLGMELYVPEDWLTDPAYESRRRDARIPEDLPFRTKPETALGLIDRARRADVPHACIGGDAEFGDSRAFRAQLREWDEPDILGVTPGELRVIPEETPIEAREESDGPGRQPTVSRYPETVEARSPADLAAELDAMDEDEAGHEIVAMDDDPTAWTAVSWTEGSDGEQSAEVFRRRVRIVTDTQRRAGSEETGWLLVQRRDGELTAWICWGVDDWTLERLVEYAHQRWMIEQFHREGKQFFGLNEFEGRTWGGWHHHVTMVLLAYAFLSRERARPDRAGVERLPPLSELARAVRRETCIQELMDEQDMERKQATENAETMVRVLDAER